MESKQLDYSKKAALKPSYKMTKLTPREGSANITITTSGGQEAHFDIPQKAYNLSKSILSFTMAPPAIAGNYNYMYMDTLSCIRQLQFYSRSGVMLCDLNEVGNITKMIWKPETSLKKFLSLENHDNGTGSGSMLQKCNRGKIFEPGSDAKRLAALETNPTNAAGVGDTSAGNEAGNIHTAIDTVIQAYQDTLQAYFAQPHTNARRHDDTLIADETGASSFVDVPYKEAKYFTVGAVNTADPVINVKIDLGMIYNTIFEVDKTLLFDEIMTLRIVFAPSTKIYYYGDDPLSPGGGTLAAAAGNVTLSDLKLFLATETRPEIIGALQQKLKSGGLEVIIPYSHVYKNSFGAATSQNVILRFDRAHGVRLKRIYHGVFHGTENKNTAYDHDNRSDAKVSEFYTSLDSQRLQEFNVDTSAYEDYMLLKPKLAGSAILNSNVYQYNWFWMDDFTGDSPLWKKDPNVLEGLDLDQERRWEFIATTPNSALNHYSLAVVQKILKITNLGVTLS